MQQVSICAAAVLGRPPDAVCAPMELRDLASLRGLTLRGEHDSDEVVGVVVAVDTVLDDAAVVRAGVTGDFAAKDFLPAAAVAAAVGRVGVITILGDTSIGDVAGSINDGGLAVGDSI